jgi:hypothetical protein
VESVCLAFVIAEVVFLAGSYFTGMWLVEHGGGGVATDFVNVWAAGRLVLGGHAAAAYDWPTHKLAEDSALGHAFDGYYGWHYPPPFLFVAAALAFLPYTFAFLVWTAGTFLTYLAACGCGRGRPCGGVLASLRQRQLGGLPALDADHQPRRADRGPCRLGPLAKPVRPGALARRQ